MATMDSERENGTPVELASYHCDVGQRRIVGQRVDGAVRLTEVPAGGGGRAYLIEPKLESKAALEALVGDDLAMASPLAYVRPVEVRCPKRNARLRALPQSG